ncbi:MAG: serine protease [Rhodospirillaceae bacterium]|nr:serine protease [Rhodospirillaceae bacterium]MBT5193141.1 serine protease [Rhodospirillaceae bacterium]MBT5894874.1 serine protease [Rhodospirillaceae bacterium]MBT6431051.1 serine protease [Rhodospirillaceae bacterium]MBT7756808.1 serine protease [Rhodospirillaceae bacterium]
MPFAAALTGTADAAKLPFDVDTSLATVVRLHSEVPADGYTAPFLGTEREGNGIIIDDSGLILTIGYLIVEAMAISLTTAEGRVIPAEMIAYDYDSGFGLVRALEDLQLAPIALGKSEDLTVGSGVLVAGHGGREAAIGARVVSKREFAGYWEYMLDEAIFTAPAHPNWGGAALIGQDGKLLGVGSLYVEDAVDGQDSRSGNMFVPIDLLAPIMEEMLREGRTAASHRPWLGMFTAEVEGRIEVIGLANDGPAERSGLQVGDVIVKVNGQTIATMVELYRTAWSVGAAGVEIPMTLLRETYAFELNLKSEDRYSRLKFQQGY